MSHKGLKSLVTRSQTINCYRAAPSVWGNPTELCADGNVGV
jgi:hypothetical protein